MHITKYSGSVTASSAGVSTTDTPTFTGSLVCVAYTRPATNPVSSSRLLTIGRDSSDDLVMDAVMVNTTVVQSFYPGKTMCKSTNGSLFPTSGIAQPIPLADSRLTFSIDAASSINSVNLNFDVYVDGVAPSTI